MNRAVLEFLATGAFFYLGGFSCGLMSYREYVIKFFLKAPTRCFEWMKREAAYRQQYLEKP